MTTDQPAGPWAAVVGDWDVPGMLPIHAVQLHRLEAAEAAEEQRTEAERVERADTRQTVAMWQARQHALARGLPWDPQRPFEHSPSVYDKANALFAIQDAEARRADFKAAEAAGLLHLLHEGPEVSPPPSGSLPPPGPAGGTGAATRASILTKIREARGKWSRPKDEARRSRSLNEPHTVTRFTADANPRIY